jgi:hypothetical protein
MRRARTSEVPHNLNLMFKSAATLYTSEYTKRGVAATYVRSCVVSPTDRTPATPTRTPQRFIARDGFEQLAFTIADAVYFGYGITSVGIADDLLCLGHAGVSTFLYTLFAEGDLDGNSTFSRFEMTAGADENGNLYHSHGLYMRNELE